MNVAQGLVYHYFKSKTEILYAVIDALSEEQVQVSEKVLAEFEGNALDCLSMLFKSRPEIQNNGEIFESILSDQGVIEYCSTKMTVSMMPLLLMLIKRGNADGSWQCEFPQETAAFILHGMSGIFELSPSNHNDERKREAFTNIIFRLLGVMLQGDSDHTPDNSTHQILNTHYHGLNNTNLNPHREDLPECLL